MKTSITPYRASYCFALLLGIFLYLFPTLLCAQLATITGRVLDQTANPLPYANVLLLDQRDSSLVRGELTNDDGYFTISGQFNGLYFIEASLIGFSKQQTTAFQISPATDITLPDLILSTGVELDAVTITAEKPLIELAADKMIVNVANSSLNAGNSALEILAKAPGVAIDNNNNINLKGRSGVLITINGKQQYLSNEDIARMLENMPASGIEKIEIITNPSAKYDAEGNSGIINIVLNRNENFGTNGQISSTLRRGFRTSHFHNANLNFRTNKFSLLGSAEYYNWGNLRELNLIRNIPNAQGSTTNFDQLTIMDQGGDGFNARLAADYELSPQTTIGLMARINRGNEAQNNDNVTDINGPTDLPFRQLDVQGLGDEDYQSTTYNFNVEHRFVGDQVKLNFDVDYNTYRKDVLFRYENNYFNAEGIPFGDAFFLRNFQNIDVDILAGKTDISWNVSEKTSLEAGLKYSQVNTINATIFEFLDGQNWTNQPERSNTFDYEESVSAAYLNSNFKLGKFGLQAGLRVERTYSKGFSATLEQTVERSYTNLFPSLSISQPINDDHELSYSYSYRLNRPNYNNLNPFEFFLDDFTRGKGNPFLNPQYTHSLGANYAWKSKLYVSLNYSRTNDQINQVIEQNSAENITISTSDNLESFTNVSLSVSVPKVWSETWTSRLNYVAYYNDFSSAVQAGQLDNSIVAHRFYLANNFTLPNNWSLEVNGSYNTKTVFGFFFREPWGGLDLGVSKKLGKNGSLKVSANDIFQTQASRHFVKTGEIDLVDQSIYDSRRVSLTLSWKFGNSKVKSVRKRKTAGQEEQDRI